MREQPLHLLALNPHVMKKQADLLAVEAADISINRKHSLRHEIVSRPTTVRLVSHGRPEVEKLRINSSYFPAGSDNHSDKRRLLKNLWKGQRQCLHSVRQHKKVSERLTLKQNWAQKHSFTVFDIIHNSYQSLALSSLGVYVANLFALRCSRVQILWRRLFI